MSDPLIRVLCTMSPELVEVIDGARGDVPRTIFIERLLRQHPKIKKMAKELKIEWEPRRRGGRYQQVEK